MKKNFLSKKENKISNKFEKNGFIIFDLENRKFIDEVYKVVNKILKLKNKNFNNELNYIHKRLNLKDLNKFRLKIYDELNKSIEIKKLYYHSCKKMLDILVGNELVMQKRINLSIQLPKDNSSLLPLHSDVWSGDSPYEVVVWIPLVDCYGTKTMYILPPNHYKKVENNFKKYSNKSSTQLFNKIKKNLDWIDIKFGEILVFNQALPHGNIVNKEKETRWSMNCRFKSVFSPYGDKKIGEFFEPITLRAASEIGIKYKLPEIKK